MVMNSIMQQIAASNVIQNNLSYSKVNFVAREQTYTSALELILLLYCNFHHNFSLEMESYFICTKAR